MSGGGGHGRVELREEEEFIGELAEVRVAHTLCFILAALLASYPELVLSCNQGSLSMF
jgi:hypothetical protein